MGVNRGPQYPGIEDGLIFCFDPKNRDCWNGGTNFTDLVKDVTLTGTNLDNDEFASALTTEGYVNFDGTDDYINCGQIEALKGASSWTISGWYKQPTLDQRNFMFGATVNSTNWISAETWNDGQMYFEIRNGASSYAQFDYSTVVTADEWFHVAMVFDGTQASDNDRLIAFINGSQVSLNYSAAAIPTSTNATIGDFYIGHTATQSDEWAGGIGPVYIYNRNLLTSEILTNYNNLKVRFGL